MKSTRHVEFGEGDDKVQGFEAVAEALLVQGNQVISAAEAMCLNDEPNWARKPLFQLKSMSQTRACAKAMRNVLAWVAVLAGYSATPAEEMTGEEESYGIQMPKRTEPVATRPAAVQDAPKAPKAPRVSKTQAEAPKTITDKQRVLLWAKCREKELPEDKVRDLIGRHGFEHTKEITQAAFDKILTEVETL